MCVVFRSRPSKTDILLMLVYIAAWLTVFIYAVRM